MAWRVLVSAAAALAVLWLVLLLLLWRGSVDRDRLKEAVRLLPDLVRLLSRLGRDRAVARGLRLRLWLLLGYLALPVDLVPDVLPVIGYADDAVLVLLVLRSVLRGVDRFLLERHWPGSPAGLAAVERLAGRAPQ